MNIKSKFFTSTILVALLITSFYIFNSVIENKSSQVIANNSKYKVEVFKTPSCGCCYGYFLFLEEKEFEVK